METGAVNAIQLLCGKKKKRKKEMVPLISPGLSQKSQNVLINCFLTVAICMIASRVSCNPYIPSSYVFIENSLVSAAIKNMWKI